MAGARGPWGDPDIGVKRGGRYPLQDRCAHSRDLKPYFLLAERVYKLCERRKLSWRCQRSSGVAARLRAKRYLSSSLSPRTRRIFASTRATFVSMVRNYRLAAGSSREKKSRVPTSVVRSSRALRQLSGSWVPSVALLGSIPGARTNSICFARERCGWKPRGFESLTSSMQFSRNLLAGRILVNEEVGSARFRSVPPRIQCPQPTA